MRSQWDRRVIPRWRSSDISAMLPEVKPTEPRAPSKTLNRERAEFDSQFLRWKENSTVGGAADLLNFWHVPEFADALREPANFLVNHDYRLPKALSDLTSAVLKTAQPRPSRISMQVEIARLRGLLRENPADPIRQIDIARLYAARGYNDKASRAVRIAVSMLPNHRFVMRSASRFYLHAGDPEFALRLLQRSDRTQHDPWLLASHIALETILGKSPRYGKRAQVLLKDETMPRGHLAELGAALATVHLINGAVRDAKRAFNVALVNPNENAVAQAVWASQQFGVNLSLRHEWFEGPFSFEANLYKYQAAGDFANALECAKDWFADEPFSSRPLKAAAFFCCILEDYDQAIIFLKQALELDSGDSEARCNLGFAFASKGEITQAVETMGPFLADSESPFLGHVLANFGLIYYRGGSKERGRELYRRAIEFFTAKNLYDSKALGLSFWVRAAHDAGDEEFPAILREATDFVDKSENSSARSILDRLRKQGPAAAKNNFLKPAESWIHDRERNILEIKVRKPFTTPKIR